MRQSLHAAISGTALTLIAAAATPSTVLAQDVVTPATEPTVTAPTKPDDADESFDENAIQQLMKIVQLSRYIGGGIGQIFASLQTQQEMLESIRDAQTGPKDFPDLGEDTGREGGLGLKEMADGAMGGAVEGPEAMVAAFEKFRENYYLEDAFALQDDELPSKKMVARLSSQGAIAASTAEASYKRANAGMERLDGYATALAASEDLKTSIDINTRVMIEVAQQINETLRTQAALASVAGGFFMMLGGEVGQDDTFIDMKTFNR
ncbi:type IV secretion system protein [Notoacmeibacter ruber]|uniref:Uncharacterized protein n=1 Tax=Notoacmeibacter ruber TaxID=2670375 RepID=A0A3L7J732_9HYPH|nr:type IV secretion system protein [Notoacmeibacter ruber]RLQ85251.1 hypothetical protein D8780_14920 [Notoacmeibacter ruber]